jgi:hypothetical protein
VLNNECFRCIAGVEAASADIEPEEASVTWDGSGSTENLDFDQRFQELLQGSYALLPV